MAQKSLVAAGKVREVDPRSSASRYYYAAYQAVSGLLLYTNPTLNPPANREAWNHAETPLLIVTHLAGVEPRLDKRQDMRRRLELLYKVRVSSDYISRDSVEGEMKDVAKHAGFLVKTAVSHTGVVKVKR